MMQWAIGVDLGGTNIRAADVDEHGRVGAVASLPIDHNSEAAEPFGQLVDVISQILRTRPEPPAGIGVGATGPIDTTTGYIENPHTLPRHLNGDARTPLEEEFSLPVRFENDANAAALAEARFGSGQNRCSVVCITIGTGVGVGLVRGGVPHSGVSGTHPEAGHATVDAAGPLCYCGGRGCIESLASGTAVLAAGIADGVVDSNGTTQAVFDAARQGDARARHIVDRAQAAVAVGARNLVAAHAADTVVLTGGALGDADRLVRVVRLEIDSFSFGPRGGVLVAKGALGSLAGCIGAAALMLNSRESA